MILYFSGTGNSRYCAKYLSEKIEDDIIDLSNRLKKKDYSPIESTKPFIIVCPIYAWRIPRVISDFIEKTKFVGNKDIYFVVTCGSESYDAGKYLEKLCNNKKLNYKGIAEVVMPGNYIIMFDSPSDEEIKSDYENVPKVLDNISYYVLNDKSFPNVNSTFIGKIMSGIVNDAFYPLFVNDKKFVVDDNCIGCGKCVANCPLSNIELKNLKPSWNGNCTQCMACISNCPTNAIEYGNATKGKQKYICKL